MWTAILTICPILDVTLWSQLISLQKARWKEFPLRICVHRWKQKFQVKIQRKNVSILLLLLQFVHTRTLLLFNLVHFFFKVNQVHVFIGQNGVSPHVPILPVSVMHGDVVNWPCNSANSKKNTVKRGKGMQYNFNEWSSIIGYIKVKQKRTKLRQKESIIKNCNQK